MPDLCVTSARPVRVSNSGKVKRIKRKPNDLGTLSTVAGFVYPGGQKKLVKDATTAPISISAPDRLTTLPAPETNSAPELSPWEPIVRLPAENVAPLLALIDDVGNTISAANTASRSQ